MAPVDVNVTVVIGKPKQTIGFEDATVTVFIGLTVIIPFAVATVHEFQVVVIV